MTEKVRWGILAPGIIARKFATGLSFLADAEIVAVGSRTQESGERFAQEFDVPTIHVGYEKLAADPNVDAIYIASPHSFHAEQSILCLEQGKAVLCEKPFTINAAEARRVVDAARANHCFLMEAMWTRHLPMTAKMRALVADGVIGDIRMITGDLGFRTGFNPHGRLFAPELGGGGLLDVGVYPISLVSMFLGKPARIVSMADIGETGVDEQAAAIFGFPGGEMAIIHTAIRTNTLRECAIMGTDGQIRLHAPALSTTHITVSQTGKEPEEIEVPYVGNGYNYQAAEVHRCLKEGLTESPNMPLDETISIMETMDAIRAQWGLKYPME